MNQKYKAIILMPYFGKLPDMFPFWARSVPHESQIKWLIMTDAELPCDLPENVVVAHTTFADVQARIRSHYNFEVKIDAPYDLCAFKPAYGDIFQKECAGYDFWGWGDSTLYMGILIDSLRPRFFRKMIRSFAWGISR